MMDNIAEYARRTPEAPQPAWAPVIATLVIATIPSAVTLLVLANERSAGPVSLVDVVFLGWAIAPYGAFAIVAWACRRSRAFSSAWLTTALFVSGPSLFILYDAFYVNLDPQSALVIPFLPMWQFVALAVGGAGAAVLAARSARK